MSRQKTITYTLGACMGSALLAGITIDLDLIGLSLSFGVISFLFSCCSFLTYLSSD